jgi:ubiquinone/menaquinone biosynthesis C-methylase UbiE
MRLDWDERAMTNARYFVGTGKEVWSDEEFYGSGQQTLERHIMTDLPDICQGMRPENMKVLEIGCGAGRVTRALAKFFGEVHAVDVSSEMVRWARQAVSTFPNAFIYQNNGMDLSVVSVEPFDFAFSCLVFQHIPCKEIIQNYVREVHRLLRPGALFKFQSQGNMDINLKHLDTWVGMPFSETQVIAMAEQCGFESRYRHGVGGQEFWNWFFRI